MGLQPDSGDPRTQCLQWDLTQTPGLGGLFREHFWSFGAVGALIPCVWNAVPWLSKVPLGIFLTALTFLSCSLQFSSFADEVCWDKGTHTKVRVAVGYSFWKAGCVLLQRTAEREGREN